MGAEYADITYKDCKNFDDVKRKFEETRDNALFEWGHAGYTGSFAEKDAVERRTEPGQFVTRQEAFEDCHSYPDGNDKWGPTWAYQLDETTWYVGGWCSC